MDWQERKLVHSLSPSDGSVVQKMLILTSDMEVENCLLTLDAVGVDGLGSVTVMTGWPVGGGLFFLTGDILVSFFLRMASLTEHPKYLGTKNKNDPSSSIPITSFCVLASVFDEGYLGESGTCPACTRMARTRVIV